MMKTMRNRNGMYGRPGHCQQRHCRGRCSQLSAAADGSTRKRFVADAPAGTPGIRGYKQKFARGAPGFRCIGHGPRGRGVGSRTAARGLFARRDGQQEPRGLGFAVGVFGTVREVRGFGTVREVRGFGPVREVRGFGTVREVRGFGAVRQLGHVSSATWHRHFQRFDRRIGLPGPGGKRSWGVQKWG